MKRLFRKDNRIARLIAMWLVFIMALTPLYEHSGLKNPTKAADGTMEYELSISVGDFVTPANEKTVIKKDDGSGNISYAIDGEEATIHNMYYWYRGTVESVQLTGKVDGYLSFDNNDQIEYQYKVKVYEGGTPSEVLDDDTGLEDPTTALEVTRDTDIYAIYVKVKDFSYGDTEPKTEASSANNKWHLLTSYKLVGKNISSNEFKWSDGTDLIDGTVKDACLPNVGAVSDKDVFIGTFTYHYAKGSFSSISGAGTNLKPFNHSTMLTDTVDEDGTYTGFVKYFMDSDETAYYELDTKIEIDNTNPTFIGLNSVAIDNTPSSLKEVNPEDGVYYISNTAEGNYAFAFRVTDDNKKDPMTLYLYDTQNATTFAQTVEAKLKQAGMGIYETKNINKDFGLTTGIIYELRGPVLDKAGNEAVDINGNLMGDTAIAKLCLVDPTFTASYTVSNGAITSPTKEQQSITVTVSSGDPLGKIVVYDDNNPESSPICEVSLADVELRGGLYSATRTIYLPPSDASGNAPSEDKAYKNIKMKVYEAGDPSTDKGEVKSFNDVHNDKLVYDVTDPTITGSGSGTTINVYKDNVLISDSAIFNGVYSMPVESASYKFSVKAEDTGSGIKSVTMYTDSTKTTKVADLTDGNNDGIYEFTTNSYTIKGYLDNSPNKTVAFWVEVIDNVDNHNNMTITPAFALTREELDIDSTFLKVSDTGEPVEITGNSTEKYSYCKAFELEITVSSGYPIDTIEVTTPVYDATTGTTTYETLSQATVTDQENIDGRTQKSRYVITKTLTIPNSISENTLIKLMESVKVTVTDKCVDEGGNPTPQQATRMLGDLLYDATLPEIKDAATNSAFAADLSWYRPATGLQYITIGATANPGKQTGEESELASFTYDVANTATNNVTGSTAGVVIAGDKASATATINIPQSKTADGTKITLIARDAAGNETKQEVVRRVDYKEPSLPIIKVNGISLTGGETDFAKVSDTITIETTARDNLSLKYINIEIRDSLGATYKSYGSDKLPFGDADAMNYDPDASYVEKSFSYKKDGLTDGYYYAIITVCDKTGIETSKTVKFEVDNTAPFLSAKISSGEVGKESTYYHSNVVVMLTCEEKNSANIVVTDNDNKVDVDWNTSTNANGNTVWTGYYTVNTEGSHTVKINATDGTNNPAEEQSVYFIKDTDKPRIQATLNGLPYASGDDVRVFRSDAILKFTEVEEYADSGAFYYQMTKKVPDENPIEGTSNPTAYRDFTYSEEAEYTVKVYSVDKANLTSEPMVVQFRIDKTAPNISIGGIASGGTSSSGVTVSLSMQELYWQNARGTVEIYMRSGEGAAETLVEQISYVPTGRNTVLTRTFAESGVYRIEFNAEDSAGHTATTSSTFTVDTEAPKVTLEGVDNYDITDQDVVISSVISDLFYASKKVTVTGTKTDIDGKVTPIVIDSYSATANPTTINETFTEDGIYDLTISCVDVAGNSHSQSVHFTIDKSDPVIGDLSDIEGKILTSFEWEEDLDELVSDLTVCDVHMYLNGQEYNGEDAVEDGSYVLLITAEDELGHIVEKSVEFVLDTKAPVFIVTGVEDKESRIEPYSISVSLQLEEDILNSVTLNGQVITINGNTATFEVTEIGEYKLYMEAIDEAGNVSSAEYEFELESENQFNIWILIGILALLLVVVIIIILKKKSKNNS